jgi:hypothetical protein
MTIADVSNNKVTAAVPRRVIFITHAAPEDNEFSIWLSAQLASAGYDVWVDLRRLRGGDDFWEAIDRTLRNDTIKQIVVFSKSVVKDGVKKELAIGDVVRKKIGDISFMIPIRVDDVAYSDAPPELIRRDILTASPNWHDCLDRLFETLRDANVPKSSGPNTEALGRLLEAREAGRRSLKSEPESLISNWFQWRNPPERVRLYAFEGTQDQMLAWLKDCRVPFVRHHRLAVTFADPAGFAESGSFDLHMSTREDLPFQDFVDGKSAVLAKDEASKAVVNLMRQHFDATAEKRGLRRVEFAGNQVGWFFPNDAAFCEKIGYVDWDGETHKRLLTGKAKTLRWHVCLVAKPRLRPDPIFRVHANVVLSEDGQNPLPGDKIHKKRRRLTKSWWNDVWRDRLLAAMSFLGAGEGGIVMPAGNETPSLSCLPIRVQIPLTYDGADVSLIEEETDEGEIIFDPRLNDRDEADLEDEE